MADGRKLVDAIDEHAGPLIQLYEKAARRLQLLTADAAANGSRWGRDYRQSQLDLARTILARLKRQTPAIARQSVETAYTDGAWLVDATVEGGTGIAFGGIHQRAADTLALALAGKLDEALGTVGRRQDDLFRRVGLEQTALAQAMGLQGTHPTAAAIRRELEVEGQTAFVDRAGRRWSLESYSVMVARTTTREAVSVATGNRMVERGQDLVTVSKHEHQFDECSEWEGRTFSLTGATAGVPVLRELPPFHPNCRHVIFPAAARLEDPLNMQALETRMLKRRLQKQEAAALAGA